jgi:C4-dicarboxylate-binding protein DctP
MNWRIFLWPAVFLLAIVSTGTAWAGPAPLLRISVENQPDHVQTRFVRRFADELREAAGGRLNVRFFDQARLFRGADVIYALRQGRVEMAVPGTWHLGRVVPDLNLFLLPAFYGRPPALTHQLQEGALGRELNDRLETVLNVHVAGGWLDLGHAHLFGVRRNIEKHDDIPGLRIRIPGGPANARRIELLGGVPASIPWPDLPAWLDRGAVDGILTTPATAVSARLWEHGVTSGFLDRQYFPQYVPLIAGPFWARLSPDLRDLVHRTWSGLVADQRAAAAADQRAALDTLRAHGVRLTRPGGDALAERRERMLPRQAEMAAELGIDPSLYGRAAAALQSPGWQTATPP